MTKSAVFSLKYINQFFIILKIYTYVPVLSVYIFKVLNYLETTSKYFS